MPFPHTLFVVFWAAVVLGSIAFLLYPSVQNRITKAATVRFGKQLQQHPALGETYAQTLHTPVGRIDLDTGLPAKTLPTLISSLPSHAGDFFIHHRQSIRADSYLLITTINYYQPNERATVLGPSSSYLVTRLTYNLNFVLQLDALTKQLVVLSDPYTSLVDKNLRADFLRTLSKRFQL